MKNLIPKGLLNTPSGYKVAKTTITDEGVVVEYELIEPVKVEEKKLYAFKDIHNYYLKQHPVLTTIYSRFTTVVSIYIYRHINAYIELAWIAFHVNPKDWRPTDGDEGYTIVYNHEHDTLDVDRPAFHSGYSHGSIVFAKHDDALKVIEANPELLRKALGIFNTPM